MSTAAKDRDGSPAKGGDSSTTRPLPIRMRSDLTVRRHRYHGRPCWVVKEPVGLKYFRFEDEEYAVLQMLNGKSSLEDIKQHFELRFAPQKITLTALQHFIGTLHKSGLVVASAAGQGKELWKRGSEQKRKEMLSTFTNVFAIRWKGIDPEATLNFLYPFTGWLFTPADMLLWLFTAISALLLVTVQFDVMQAKLPSFHAFFGPANWIWLGITIAVVKVLHEFGHGLSCKHFGGECHEMGFMMLVFTPALYCNVSDSWLLPNKWHRAFIGAAGMYVEVGLAAIATFLWWFSNPGLFNNICLSIMFTCSVSTVLFNGNPLLRFDGYYILADLIEIPNLRQKATQMLQQGFFYLVLGIENDEPPTMPLRARIMLGIFALASALYRWVIVLSILLFLNAVFEPYGLQIIGQALGLAGFFGLVVQPAIQMVKFLQIPGRREDVKSLHVIGTLAVVGALVAGILLIPLPHYVHCPVTLRPQDATAVYVEVPGTLDAVKVASGQPVKKGETVLAELSNLDLELAVADLRRKADDYALQLAALERLRFDDPDLAGEIPHLREALVSVRQQLKEREQELARLTIVAPASGTVIPEWRSPQQGDGTTLARWSGSPLMDRNEQAYLQRRDLLCYIGDPERLSALLVIDQNDIELVKTGASVRVQIDALPSTIYMGKLHEIAGGEMKSLPPELAQEAGGSMATRVDSRGAPVAQSVSYLSEVPLDDTEGILKPGLRGRAKIFTGYQTVGTRLWRWATRTFHFEL